MHLIGAIERRFAAIVSQMSQWDPQSLLSRFNRAPAGCWLALPQDFATVLGAGLDIAERTGGAFDPTHGRAAALLGFGAVTVDRPPTRGELDEAFESTGWQRLALDRTSRRVRQPGGLWLDLSAIAKGFAADAVSHLLAEQGVEDALVEIGGELVGRGLRPDGQPWWVDVEDPPGVALPPLRIGLHEIAIATSGDYVRGAHTLDPRTGRPLGASVISASVVHESAMMADGWATALTVLGPEAGIAVATREDLSARLVTRSRDATERISPRLARMIEA
ncbi:FAD:protein FMN transferase [Sphingomonas oryzagri]|uniref:FAD:protein FMN transferase n=1 Tax=Sphingomonas oryzagri TaxID=3042314 RepID=A0ABT6N3B6_9SPHN|nr:FAD:protein FMN transferase [Sphingomonas oryzagri]MDH7639258.1 FAD:protein FMN transferase [Sphingomonas oryzagri]